MTKSSKLIATLGVVAGLGVAALPLGSVFAETVSGDVQLVVEVQPAIAMTISGNNDGGDKSGGTFTAVVPAEDTSLVGYYSYSEGVYTALTEGAADGTTTYYQPVTPTYGDINDVFAPAGAAGKTLDGHTIQATQDTDTSSSSVSLLPYMAVEGGHAGTAGAAGFGSTITVWTNNNSGYTLSVKDKDNDTNLTHQTGAFNIPTSSEAVSAGAARWNFDSTPDSTKSSYAGKTNQAMPASSSEGVGVVINQTAAKTSGGSPTYVDYNVSTAGDQATGIYTDTIVYTATTN